MDNISQDGQDVIDIAMEKFKLSKRACTTTDLKLHGHDQPGFPADSIAAEDITRAVSDEMCVTAEDYLSRRTRHLLLDDKVGHGSSTCSGKNHGSKNEQGRNLDQSTNK